MDDELLLGDEDGDCGAQVHVDLASEFPLSLRVNDEEGRKAHAIFAGKDACALRDYLIRAKLPVATDLEKSLRAIILDPETKIRPSLTNAAIRALNDAGEPVNFSS
jgi:hypothetical protein